MPGLSVTMVPAAQVTGALWHRAVTETAERFHQQYLAHRQSEIRLLARQIATQRKATEIDKATQEAEALAEDRRMRQEMEAFLARRRGLAESGGVVESQKNVSKRVIKQQRRQAVRAEEERRNKSKMPAGKRSSTQHPMPGIDDGLPSLAPFITVTPDEVDNAMRLAELLRNKRERDLAGYSAQIDLHRMGIDNPTPEQLRAETSRVLEDWRKGREVGDWVRAEVHVHEVLRKHKQWCFAEVLP